MNRLLIYIAILLIACASVFAQGDEHQFEPLTLLGRSHTDDSPLKLDAADVRWLRSKRTLVIGTSLTDSPPFDIPTNQAEYEGVTADYAELLSDLLRINITVRRYENRDLAIQALKDGELDMLGSAGIYEESDPALVMSHPYIEDEPTLVTRRAPGSPLSRDLEGKRLVMSSSYAPLSEIKRFYPQAKLNLYPTVLDALSAVAFGQADVYIGDAITANYLISRNFSNEIQLVDASYQKVSKIGFALRSESHQLLGLVNQALAAVPPAESMAITRRWVRHIVNVRGREGLSLTADERQWLDEHPRLRVAVIEDSPPASFFDQHNVFRGINADLLEKVGRRMNVQFDLVRGNSTDALTEQVRRGNADLIAAFQQNAEREQELHFTRPYLTSPFVFISRLGDSEPKNLEDMSGKRLAISLRNSWRAYVSQHYPNIQLVEATSAVNAMSLVAQNKADASINTLINARFQISSYYRDRLRITSTLGTQPAQMGLATDRGALELYSILNKVLASFPPEELDELTERWRGDVMVDNTSLRANQLAVMQGVVAVVALLLVAAGWIAYLRRLIQKRESAERALNEQMEFMRVLIDGLPHPIYVRDRQTRMLLCNSRYLAAAGRPREEIIGTRPSEGLSIESHYSLEFEQQYQEVMSTGQERLRDCQLMLPDGRTIIAYHWILPFRDSSGEVKGIIAGWIDISEREQLLAELKDAKQEADNANRAKTTFLATMSHEIRTPMNAVVGMLELAMKKADQGILERFAIEVASGAARGLLDLIGDILDVVRIESGRLTLSPQRAALKELVELVVRVFEGLARQKQLALVLEFDDLADRDVLIDPLRFKQVLSNLLSNAIKFTREGTVLVSVQATLESEGENLAIQLRVRDTGIGISAEDQLKLFAPFSQVGAGSESVAAGAGLGLSISRTLCSMMHGELNLSSVSGLGTLAEVLLNLPVLAALPPSKPEPVMVLPVKELKVLVVDDYPANRLLLSQQLSYLGHNVCDEQDGAHGLRTWRNRHFDVVITDCNMPVMSGYELARAIRAEEEASSAAPCLILGFTANAQPEEIDRCLEAGMDDCLFKPISMKDLMTRLSKVESAFVQASGLDEPGEGVDNIDLSSLEQLTGGDRESIISLLRDLAKSNEEDQLRLLQLFSQNDLVGLSDLAHRVKGGARIIKAHKLIQSCEQLQSDCNELDVVRLTQSVDALHQLMEDLAHTLEQYIGELAA